MRLLPTIDYPEDLRRLNRGDLQELCDEIRSFLIQSVGQTGGHLASNLGVVELTVALHYVFDIGPDRDRLVFDVSHQSYVHKILTGRRDRFSTLRKTDGLAGFSSQYESPYDLFHVSHAGTAVSTSMGYLFGRRHADEDPGRVVALVGDAGVAAGMSLEALNYAGGREDCDLLVLLNDNRMSIAKPVGGLVRYFDKIRASKGYVDLKRETMEALERIPVVGSPLARLLPRVKEAIQQYAMNPGMLFEELGFRYFGPFDGHDVHRLISTLRDLKDTRGPVLVHALTQKGKGYEVAERDPVTYHGWSPPKKASEPVLLRPERPPPPPATESCHRHFGNVLCDVAREDPKVVALTAAMPGGTGLSSFAEEFPGRFYDVGICEQHGVAMAGGLAAGGARPVAAIYSTFLQRAYDQVVHDVALQGLRVVFCMDRAGVVGGDGMTANGAFDVAYLRPIPKSILMAPADATEIESMLRFALHPQNPDAVYGLRWPKARFSLRPLSGEAVPVELGKGVVLREGGDVVLFAYGSVVPACLAAADLLAEGGVSATVVNARFAKPLDRALILDLASRHDLFVTLEDHALAGGFGSAVVDDLVDGGGAPSRVLRLGLPDRFVEHGSRDALLERYGLGAAGIVSRVRAELERSARRRT